MSKSNVTSLTPESLRDLMQQAGYRVQIVAGPVEPPFLWSSTSGLPFEMRLVNPAPGNGRGYVDIMFTAGLQVQRGSPLDIANRWNSTKRFARLQVNQGYLVLAMDVVVLGGVSFEHLVTQITLWARLLQELQVYVQGAGSVTPARGTAMGVPRPAGAAVSAA